MTLDERLRRKEHGANAFGVPGSWYRNPDGPEAADRIAELEAAILEARGHIRRGCDMVPDEDEGLASDVFARAINHADLCLSKALGAAG